MAGIDGSALKRDEIWCEDIYTGTADQIVAAGLLRAEQLPGQPGGPKCQATFYREVPSTRRGSAGTPCDEHRVVVRRLSATRFEVLVGVSKSEQDARRSRDLARQGVEQRCKQRAEQRQQRAELVRTRIRMAPKDEAAFRASVVDAVRPMAELILLRMQLNGSAFRFTSAAVDDLRACLDDCLGRLQYLPVVHDGAFSRRCAAELAALEDQPFQAAMSDLIASGAAKAVDDCDQGGPDDAPDSEFGTTGWINLFDPPASKPGNNSNV